MSVYVLCNCAHASVLPRERVQRVRAALLASGAELVETADLCALAAERDPLLQEWAHEEVTVLACHPRAVRWLFHAGGARLAGDRVRVLNLRTGAFDDVLEQLGIGPGPTPSVPPTAQATAPEWPPWFPVIDYERCTGCRQCYNFCLFGVYNLNVEQNEVRVSNPRNCKNNCPACARICPQVAIMFPKLGEEPLNGAPVDDENTARANVKINLERILGDDVYGALKARSARARAKRLIRTREERRRQAEAERKACSEAAGEES